MLVLHRNERSQAVMDGVLCLVSLNTSSVYDKRLDFEICERTLHHLELPSPATAHSDMSHISRFDHIVKRLHGLFDRRIVVEAVTLEEINVVELESLERVLD